MTDQQTLRSGSAPDSSQPSEDIWREEIHARVAGYRNRRGRRIEGAFSMRFPFPPAEREEPVPELVSHPGAAAVSDAFEAPTASVAEAVAAPQPVEVAAPTTVAVEKRDAPEAIAVAEPESAAALCDPVPVNDPEPLPAPLPRPRTKRKVIAFPRQASSSPEEVRRLADPVVPEQPRILDVPEELEAYPSSPLLDGLQYLPNSQQSAAASPDHVELPFRPASLSQRLYAGVADCTLVAAASGIFAAVCYKMLPNLLFTKPVVLTAAALPILFWAAYQYIFMIYGGRTAGMRLAGIRLTTFKGTFPTRRHRRSRVVGLYFSTASLAMGLLWSLVDVDGLCWHDRISRTYLTHLE